MSKRQGKYQQPKIVNMTEDERKALLERIHSNELTPKDLKILEGLLTFQLWIHERLSQAKLTIGRLKRLFGFKTEKRDKQSKKDDESKDGGADSSELSPDAASDAESTSTDDTQANLQIAKKEPLWNPNANHGRQGWRDYTGCDIIDIPFSDEDLLSGCCPACKEFNSEGKLIEESEPVVIIKLHSVPLVTGHRYRLQTARCNLCQKRFTATLPEELEEQTKYDVTCCSSIAIHHYYGGMPFKRLETLQKAQGVPLPDATQIDMMKGLYGNVVRIMFETLETCAAQGNNVSYDDTNHRIQTVTMANNTLEKNSKTKKVIIHSTAFISRYNNHDIYLFYTNEKTAGKEFKGLMAKRTVDDELITMTDASSSNFPPPDKVQETLLARWIITMCLAHGRRKFFDLIGSYDEDCDFVLKVFGQVYANDKYCKLNDYDDNQRLAYHQKYSGPIMEALRVWLNNLLLYKHVEPNSTLGAAITYLLKYWHWQTQFLRVPGAKLDNNLCEQSIKIIIRYRKASLFYYNFFGAQMGDAMMSLLHTAAQCGQNIFDYLNALQIYADEVNKNPKAWLPWVYQETLTHLQRSLTDKDKALRLDTG